VTLVINNPAEFNFPIHNWTCLSSLGVAATISGGCIPNNIDTSFGSGVFPVVIYNHQRKEAEDKK